MVWSLTELDFYGGQAKDLLRQDMVSLGWAWLGRAGGGGAHLGVSRLPRTMEGPLHMRL